MSDFTVRIVIVSYGIMVFGVIVLMWLNSSAPDVSKNVVIMFASILPVVVAVLPYTSKVTKSSEYNFVLPYDSNTKAVTVGDDFNPYWFLYSSMFINLSEAPEGLLGPTDLTGFETVGLDIIEKGIVESLCKRFWRQWAIDKVEHRTPSGYSFHGRLYSKRAGVTVSIEEIRKRFSHNKIISWPNVIKYNGVTLPPGCGITAQPEANERHIRFKDKYLTTEIAIRYSSGSVEQTGVWGVLPPDPNKINRYYSFHYIVSLKAELSQLRRYSPEMAVDERWYENLAEMLSRFDWENVDRYTLETMQRKAISSTVKPGEGPINQP
jgi:hypothetical protein